MDQQSLTKRDKSLYNPLYEVIIINNTDGRTDAAALPALNHNMFIWPPALICICLGVCISAPLQGVARGKVRAHLFDIEG